MLCLQAWLSPLGCLSGHTILGESRGVRLLGPDNVGLLYTSLEDPPPSLSLSLFTVDSVL